MAGLNKADLGAFVALDHNYASAYTIRALRRDAHMSLLPAMEGSSPSVLTVPATRRATGTRTRSGGGALEPPACAGGTAGETLEEEDLAEYYSQICDRMFSSESGSSMGGRGRRGARSSESPPSPRQQRNRVHSSASFSFDYDSYEHSNTSQDFLFPPNSTHRPGSVPPTNSNLNMLTKHVGTEPQKPASVNAFDSIPSGSPHSSKESADLEVEMTRQDDYQVLAAANALLQLSGTDKPGGDVMCDVMHAERKRKYTISSDHVIRQEEWHGERGEEAWAGERTHLTEPQLNFKSFRSDSQLVSRPTKPQRSFIYGFPKTEKTTQKKKKKRKLRKPGKGGAGSEDEESVESHGGGTAFHDPTTHVITFSLRDPALAVSDPWGQALPVSLLVHVFRQVKGAAALPFLSSASRVCRLWYEAASKPALWQSVDLSGECVRKQRKHLLWLCKHRLGPARSLSLANWEALTGKELQVLAHYCRQLENISLSRCNKLNSSALRGLIHACANLTSIDLSYTSTVITSRYMLEYLLEARGAQLTSVNLATNILVKFDIVMQSIMDKCSALEVLDLSNVVFSCVLPLAVERLQLSCPRLRVLLLTNSLFKAKRPAIDQHDLVEQEASLRGFDHLEVLSVARSPVNRISKFRYVNDDVLHRLLKSSSRLRSLDITGCRHVTCAGLQRLPVLGVTSLNLSHCPLVNHLHIQHNLDKWRHSLRKLFLGGTTISPDFLRSLLDKCTALEVLSLTGCRGLPWHVRREYSADTLPELRTSLDNWQDGPAGGSQQGDTEEEGVEVGGSEGQGSDEEGEEGQPRAWAQRRDQGWDEEEEEEEEDDLSS